MAENLPNLEIFTILGNPEEMINSDTENFSYVQEFNRFLRYF